MGYIYKITNDINGKVYIGKTEKNIQSRWISHLQAARQYKQTEKRPLYDAFQKYGIQHFHIEQIEETNDTEEREQYWINYYRSYIGFIDCNGYNATLGGDGKSYFDHSDEEVIEKFRELKSIRATAQYFNCNESTISVRLHRNGLKDECTNKRVHRNVNSPAVIAISKTENIEFDSQADAAEWLINSGRLSGTLNTVSANIGRCCRGVRKTCGGYRWEYK